MKIKCDYCGNMTDERNSFCPSCGASLNGVKRFANGQPQTIEQLKEWYIKHNLPPEEVTRFFIGKNVKEPRAFGIYRDSNGDYVVYKNKSTGERAVRYCGSDESYAVNELYQRLKVEIVDQKEKNASKNSNRNSVNNSRNQDALKPVGRMLAVIAGLFVLTWVGAMILVVGLTVWIFLDDSPLEGYYPYAGQNYYYQDSTWYSYDEEIDDWYEIDDESVPDAISSDSEEYHYNNNQYDGKDFEDSVWYVEDDDNDDYDYGDNDDDDDDSGWDNDYDWDAGDSWDSGGTDWDSDW